MTGAARWLRAAFVAAHLFAVTAMALPSVGSGMNRAAWADPTVQGEFRSWSARLAALGIDLPPAALEDRAWGIAVQYQAARDAVLQPFMPYYVYCGPWQSWQMFVAPQRFPARLEIDVDRGQGWEPLYVERSDTHTWRREWFDHDRFRASIFRYSWRHFASSRRAFTDWVAGQVAADQPDAVAVRVSWVRYQTPSPAETLAGAPVDERRELVNRRDLAPLRGTR